MLVTNLQEALYDLRRLTLDEGYPVDEDAAEAAADIVKALYSLADELNYALYIMITPQEEACELEWAMEGMAFNLLISSFSKLTVGLAHEDVGSCISALKLISILKPLADIGTEVSIELKRMTKVPNAYPIPANVES